MSMAVIVSPELGVNMSALNTEISPVEEDALALVQTAVLLDNSRADPGKLVAALEANLELWVAIRTLVSRGNEALSGEARGNLLRLSQYVASETLSKGAEIDSETLNTLININMQISEGLLEGLKHRRTAADPA